MTTQDLQLQRGDTGVWDLVFTNSAGLAMNLAGATVRFTAKYSPADLDAAAAISKSSSGTGVVITDAANGKARLTVLPADTAAFAQDLALSYDVQVTDSGGVVATVLAGTLMVNVDVTQTSP